MENVILEPPLYLAEDHIFSLDFHPTSDNLCCSLINGGVNVQFFNKRLQYSSDDVKELVTLNYHEDSCRSACFSPDGKYLASGSKDKSIGFVDSNGKLVHHMKEAHHNPISVVKFLTNDIVVSGDDEGMIKVWDVRQNKVALSMHEHCEPVTDFTHTADLFNLLSVSNDGCLGVYDLRQSQKSDKKLYAMSDNMETDLLSICLMRNEKYVVVSSDEGPIFIFKWDWFGDCSDRLAGHSSSVDSLCKLDEDTYLTGCDDGKLRGCSIYPNKILSTIGQHSDDDNVFPIQKIAISRCRQIAATCSHDESIQFYDLSYFNKKKSGKTFMNDDEIDKIIEQNQEEGMEEESGDEDEDEDEFESDDDDSSEEEMKPQKQIQLKQKKLNSKQIKADAQREQKKQFFSDI